MAGKKTMVSVVIPCYNNEKTIESCVQSVLNQTYKNFEVIVVNDGSTDQSKKILESIPGIRLFHQENSGASSARNLGIQNAKGEILLLLDADAIVSNDWMELHERRQSEGKKIVGGSVTDWNDNFWGTCDRYSTWYEYHPGKKEGWRTEFISTNVSIHRSVFEKVGLFNEKLNRLEDLEFFCRAAKQGIQVFFDPRISMAHHDRETVKAWLKHHYLFGYHFPFVRNAENNARFHWIFPKNPSIAFLSIVPLAAIHTGFVVLNWIPEKKAAILFSPFILWNKINQYTGYWVGLNAKREKMRQNVPVSFNTRPNNKI